jgi:hypothetical protein
MSLLQKFYSPQFLAACCGECGLQLMRERCGPNTLLNNGAAEWNWQNLNSILLLFKDL